MDLVTQGLLGAAVGQAGFQKSLGRRALGWGAVIGMLPDLDVIVKVSSNPFAEILHHRGITHSLWFGPVVGPLQGYLLWRVYTYKGKQDSLSAWVGLAVWSLLTHPLLDLFTVYGTHLLAPFSSHRFSIPAVPIIDPFYSLTLLAAVLIGLCFPARIRTSTLSAAVALVLTTGYLFLGWAQNEKAEYLCRLQLEKEAPNQVMFKSVRAYTTMFQIFWRRVVVEDELSTRVGFISTWSPKPIQWTTFEHSRDLPCRYFLKDSKVAIFTWFTSQHYFIHYDPLTAYVTLVDTRFGFPGATALGLWGIKFPINQKGERTGPIVKINFPLESMTPQIILDLFAKAFW